MHFTRSGRYERVDFINFFYQIHFNLCKLLKNFTNKYENIFWIWLAESNAVLVQKQRNVMQKEGEKCKDHIREWGNVMLL